MNASVINANALDLEPDMVPSDAALDSLAALLVNFVLDHEQVTGPRGRIEKARTLAGVTGQNSGEHGRAIE